MDPILAAGLGLSTIITTTALEKTGEKLGEVVTDKTAKFLASLGHNSPETVTAIEVYPEKELDYPQAVETIKAVADSEGASHFCNLARAGGLCSE